MDSIDCMASIDCYSFSEHILVYVFVSLIGVYMSRGGPTRTAYSIFILYILLYRLTQTLRPPWERHNYLSEEKSKLETQK